MAFPARARFLVPLAIAVALGAWFLRAPAGGPPPAAPVVMDEAGPDAEEPDAEDPGTAGGEGTQEVAPSGDLEVPVAVAVAASPIAPPEPPTSPPAPAEREAEAVPEPPTLAATAPVPPCRSCLASKCTDADRACREDPACGELNQCLIACVADDPGCAADCSRKGAGAIAALGALMDCARDGCGAACWPGGVPPPRADVSLAAATPAAPAPPPPPEPEPPPVPCDACVAQACGPQAAVCNALPACAALEDCVGRCGPAKPLCSHACQLRLPAGAWPFQALVACSWATCQQACQPASGAAGGQDAALVTLRLMDLLAYDIALRSILVRRAANPRVPRH